MASATTSSSSTRARQPVAIDAARARAIADRRTGIGCDQLILLEPSDSADVRMRIFNADGGEVEACGNAARCVALLRGRRAADRDRGRHAPAASANGAAATIDMGEPRFGWDEIPLAYAMDTAAHAGRLGGARAARSRSTSAIPHVVFFVDDADAVDLDRLGPQIEHDPLFPERVNVNVATIDERRHPAARLGARRRPDPRLRHRRLRHRGRRDAPRAGRAARSTVAPARRRAD